MAMLRFPQSQRISPALYQRLDGTLAYFFSKEFLVSLFEKEGFLTVRSLNIFPLFCIFPDAQFSGCAHKS